MARRSCGVVVQVARFAAVLTLLGGCEKTTPPAPTPPDTSRSVPKVPEQPPDKIAPLLKEADDLENQGKLEEARAVLAKASALDTTDSRVAKASAHLQERLLAAEKAQREKEAATRQRRLWDDAKEAEAAGNLDEALRLAEQAAREREEPKDLADYRAGLARKKRDRDNPPKPEEKDKLSRIAVFLDDAKTIRMEFVRIAPGRFRMGSDAREVEIPKEFWMQVTEVTQSQWKAVMGTNPSGESGDSLPVENVSWENAREFATKLAEKTKEFGTPGLPTEAEWEYACRAGTTGTWWFGEQEDGGKDAAWGKENSGLKNHPVGRKSPNAWGLFDMCGNVWEWCEDFYADGSPDRVLRGGCRGCAADCMRSSSRGRDVPTKRAPNIGLRPVLR